jgi:cell division protein YceG involved in septum cleavage
MTLLTVIQGATDRIGIIRPTVAVASTDQQIIQLVGLAQQEGKELAKRHSWQAITKEKTFTSVAAETQTSSVPTDFDRFVDDTFFNRTEKRKLEGPLSPQQWAFHKSVVATTLVEAFRQRGNDILVTPTPTAG